MPKRPRTTPNDRLPVLVSSKYSPKDGKISASRARTDEFFKQFRTAKKKKEVKRKTTKRKIYRKTKRLRPYARKLIFLVPLGILVLERCLGILLKTEHVTDFYYEESGVEPWEIHHSASELVSISPPIDDLTSSSSRRCPSSLRYIANVYSNHRSLRSRKIPSIIHQTFLSRCLTTNFHKALMHWKFRHWSLFFYDQDAVDRLLLNTTFPEFPHLKVVVQSCATSPKLKTDLWRFLVLWLYGGVVPEFNTFPQNFNANTIRPGDDGFFLLDPKTSALSTSVMAVSPRHPLMYYAIQHTLEMILKLDNISSDSEGLVLDEQNGAWQQAFLSFQGMNSKSGSTSTAAAAAQTTGTITGIQKRSLRLGGTVGGSEEYFHPVFTSEKGLKNELIKMGVESIKPQNATWNCFHAIYASNANN